VEIDITLKPAPFFVAEIYSLRSGVYAPVLNAKLDRCMRKTDTQITLSNVTRLKRHDNLSSNPPISNRVFQ